MKRPRNVPGLRSEPAPPSRTTKALGAVAIATTAAVVVAEYLVWRRGRVPEELRHEHPLEARVEAARETVEVAVEGYRTGTPREVALFNLLISFALSWSVIRLSTHRIRRRGRFLIFRDLKVGSSQRHIHHFVPGIVLAFLAGAVSIGTRNEELDTYLAFPFGLGVALTLDESALLLELDDVYWSEEGVVSVQVTLVTMSLLSLLLLARRLLRRGEQLHELAPESGASAAAEPEGERATDVYRPGPTR